MQSLLLNMLLVASIVLVILSLTAYQIHRITWLCGHGKEITALVTSVRHETGRTPAGFKRDNYSVTATWTDPRTGKRYTFWTWIMNRRPPYTRGSLVAVLIDPANPHRYRLDPDGE